MEITNSTLCVVDISQPSIYDFIEEWENPQEKLTAANQSRDKSIKTWPSILLTIQIGRIL